MWLGRACRRNWRVWEVQELEQTSGRLEQYLDQKATSQLHKFNVRVYAVSGDGADRAGRQWTRAEGIHNVLLESYLTRTPCCTFGPHLYIVNIQRTIASEARRARWTGDKNDGRREEDSTRSTSTKRIGSACIPHHRSISDLPSVLLCRFRRLHKVSNNVSL
jgi:hypothetical protein